MKLINKDKIKSNIINSKKNRDVILVLKDNAYGIGLSKVARIAVESGVDKFAIHTIQEAMVLRRLYSHILILLLGVPPKNIEVLKEYSITVSVNNFEEYLYFSDKRVDMHIKIDMGMNRFGFKEIYHDVLQSKFVKGIYMHTFTTNSRINNYLVKRFINKIGKTDKLVHIGGTTMLDLETNICTRYGMGIYKDAISLIGRIIYKRTLKKGEGIGYDKIFVASEDTLIGVCNIGYVNGLSKKNNGNSFVYINDKKYKIVGSKCMDVCFVIIDEKIKVGDEVEFLGRHIKLAEFARMNEKSIYEIFLQIK